MHAHAYNRTCAHTDTHHTDDIVHNVGTIGPNAEFTYTFDIVGLKLGKTELVVGLGSDQVELVTGEKEVGVIGEEVGVSGEEVGVSGEEGNTS